MDFKFIKKILIAIALVVLTCCQNGKVSPDNNATEQSLYLAKKNELESNSNAHSFDADIVLTAAEELLNIKMSLLRKNIEAQMNLGGRSFYTEPFLKLKPAIDSSLLYHILRIMPKGGLLHSHSWGVTDIDWVINRASTLPECYVYLRSDSDQYLYGQLSVFRKGQVPDGFINLGDKLKSSQEFASELHDMLVLKSENLLDSMDVWEEFEKRFRRIGNLVNYRPFFKQYYRKAFLDLSDDNVQHVEIRMIFDHLYDFQNHSYPIETIITDIQSIVSDIQKETPKFTLKLIYTSFKFFSVEDINSQIAQAIALKRKYPDIIVGFDLVAEEDGSNEVFHFKKSWQKLDSLKKEYNIELPLFLHAGESTSSENKNLFDVVLLDNKRVGHGLNLAFFPEVMSEIIKKDILVEICPLSNQILGYVADHRNHPGRILLNNGVQCSISSDDPSVFGYKGLTYDFWIVCTAWELDLRAIKKLVYNSINYSSLSREKKKVSIEFLDRDWNSFIAQANELLLNQN